MKCQECGTELPLGARFCIECAAPVAATGRTERLQKVTPLEPPWDGMGPCPFVSGALVVMPASGGSARYVGTAQPAVLWESVYESGGSVPPVLYLRRRSEAS